ncbi:Xylulose kinase [compost metagenome]
MNREIYRVEQEEQACAGAAMMAGIGTKLYSSVEEACSVIVKQTKEPVTPIAANVRLYEELYGIYQDAYAQNRTLFHRLGQL